MKLQKFSLSLTQSWLYYFAILAVGLLAYSTVLIIGIPERLNQLFLADDSALLFIVSFVLLYLAYRPSGWLGKLTSFSATVILFALQLSGLWRSGLNQSFYVLAGLLAMTDTEGYYNSAQRLLEGDTLSVFASSRPLAHGVLATILGLTGQNLQVTFAILTFITTIALYLLAREVQRTQGTAAGVLLITGLFLFYRKYLGTASTENWGLTLGAIALAILWCGATNKRINLCLLSLLLLTLALNTRAGAFFILPALILWGAWTFRGSSRLSVRFLIGGASMVLLGFILNSLVSKVISSPDALGNSNFAYSLYGLIVGGDWMAAVNRNPELLDIEEPQRSQRVYQLALEALRTNPFRLVSGCLRAWTAFLWDDFIFSFVTSTKVNVVLQILSLVALVKCYRQRQLMTSSLVLALTIGILLSVPFVPPWDAGIRPYAATIPFLVLLPALGLTFIAQKMQWENLLPVRSQQARSGLLWVFAAILIVLTVVGPIATAIASNPPQFAEISCPTGTEAVYFRYSSGSSIHLVSDRAARKSYVPNLRVSDFRKMVNRYLATRDARVPELAKELTKLSPDTTLINKIDLKTKETIWAIAPKNILPKENGIVGACGKRTNNPIAKKMNDADGAYLRYLFYPDSMTLVSR